ncbi:cytochrome P450 [Sphingomonas profundi]|uniref:cytochrome P450 n=1 Tax=Alterirhizorhabdus profundi TaxID=2681549 RepID=UPI0012E90B2A|nr:cytochrome P450 [Sphingomonas profundi]
MTSLATAAPPAIPDHVPPDRIVDFDIFQPAGVEEDYFAAWLALQRPGGPDLVWTPRNGGHWIATGGEAVRQLWGDAAALSSEVLAVTPGLGDVMRFIPLQLDPPEHGPYRNAVMRGFASSHIAPLEPQVVALANDLIDGLIGRGTCEFVEEFAEVLPVNLFLTLIGVPTEDRPRLRVFGKQLTRPDGSMTVEELAQAVDDYLWPFLQQRLEMPGDDLFSRILSVPIQGRAWTVDEAKRMCRNLLFGGLDTVAAMLGMVALHLARNPADQARLRAEPDLIPAAADELMRRYPTVSVSRNLVADVAVDGVEMKAGDLVYLPSVLHNLDPRSFDAPQEVRFDRKLNAVKHTTMGAGPHRCVGAGLARMEVIVVMREWLRRLPPFALDPDRPVTMKGGNVGACTAVPLVWQPA